MAEMPFIERETVERALKRRGLNPSVHTDLVDKIIKRVREVSMERGGETFKHLAGLANARNTTMLDEIIEGEILGMGRRRMDAKNRAGAEWKTLRRKQTARQKLFK